MATSKTRHLENLSAEEAKSALRQIYEAMYGDSTTPSFDVDINGADLVDAVTEVFQQLGCVPVE